MLLTTVTFLILTIISSLNCQYTQSMCVAQKVGSTYCSIGKDCYLREYLVCCPTQSYSLGSYCYRKNVAYEIER